MKTTLTHRKIDVQNSDLLSPQENISINEVINYKMPFLKEKLKITGTVPVEELETSLREFRKFCVLAIIARKDNLRLGMTSSLVDEVWHQFILFTKEYQKFCSKKLGFFLHHTPTTSHISGNHQETKNFFQLYLKYFGPIDQIWLNKLSQDFRKNLEMGFVNMDCSGDGSCSSCTSECSSNCGN